MIKRHYYQLVESAIYSIFNSALKKQMSFWEKYVIYNWCVYSAYFI